MSKDKKENSFMAIALITVIIIAVVAVVYIGMNPEEKNDENKKINDNSDQNQTQNKSELIIAINCGGEYSNYTLNELENLQTETGTARYLKMGALPSVIVEGPYTYTGVSMVDLLEESFELSGEYNITVTAEDGWPSEYSYDEVHGQIMSYNETTGNESGVVQATMLLAYKEDDTYLDNSSGGPLKIVFTGDDFISSYRMISKYVVSIEVLGL